MTLCSLWSRFDLFVQMRGEQSLGMPTGAELWEVFKLDNVSDEPPNELGLPLLESDRGSLELSLICNFDDVPELLCIAIELAFTETIVLGSGKLLVETTADSVKGTLV